LADVLGWQVVVKKGEFKPGDLCIYIPIDTILPDKPDFEFLRTKHFRIKPIRLRGQASNGICFPLSILSKFPVKVDHIYTEGNDVTDVLGIIHYEKSIPVSLAGEAHGHLPGFLIMTDEDNLRSYPDALAELKDKPYYITRKDDGSSGTYFLKYGELFENGEFGVCSRKIHLKENPNNGFWKMAEKYNIHAAIRDYFTPGVPIAIQGEVVGPGIQGNPLGLKELELHLFSMFNIFDRFYFPCHALWDFCLKSGIPMVTQIEEGTDFNHTIESLVTLANAQVYPNNNKPAEGIVIRPKFPFHSAVLNKPWSSKIINELYKETE
jgi:RNA ligase (TIGR02306 family)